MKKNGFTLAELLGVIVILGFLMLLVFPSVVKKLKEGEANIGGAVQELIFNSAGNYIEGHKNQYPTSVNATYCFTLNTLVDEGEISSSLLIDSKGKTLDLNKKVEVKIQNGQKSYKMNDQCENS